MKQSQQRIAHNFSCGSDDDVAAAAAAALLQRAIQCNNSGALATAAPQTRDGQKRRRGTQAQSTKAPKGTQTQPCQGDDSSAAAAAAAVQPYAVRN